jgi:DNA (cytosine-5)-methyltransferase 1
VSRSAGSSNPAGFLTNRANYWRLGRVGPFLSWRFSYRSRVKDKFEQVWLRLGLIDASALLTSAPLKSRRRTPKKQKATEALREEAPEYRVSESTAERKFRFIDLFCGVGGFRLAFERAGCKCVWSCDWNEKAQVTYEANFGEKPYGDIHKVAVADIPPHDILCGGFPCQPFSIAGVSKKLSLGRKHGFEDKEQGNLFFEIANIIEFHQPAAFVLENVKHLKNHDKGRTFQIIYDTLTNALGYQVYWDIIDAQSVVPQHRERVFFVGFKPARWFDFPEFPAEGPKLDAILDADVPAKYTLTDHLWKYLQDYAKKHRAAGNGFGFGLFSGKDVARTLSARYFKDGSEILISQGTKRNPRRLTPRECARLMGFPSDFKIPVSDTQAYKQFGNSVVVPVVERIADQVVSTLRLPAQRGLDLVLHDGTRTALPRSTRSVSYLKWKKKQKAS